MPDCKGDPSSGRNRLIPLTFRRQPKAALTELFLELKTDTTPAIVERIVNDIDEIVRHVRFEGWQNSTVGEKEINESSERYCGQSIRLKMKILFYQGLTII